MSAYEFHEFAAIFPLIDGENFQDLKADIKENGIKLPIIVHQGKILDGRNRYNAAFQLVSAGFKIDVPFEEFQGTSEEALSYVLSTNLHRRHLNESQRAMVAARLANVKHGGRRGPTDTINQTTIQEASRALNVSTASIKRAKKVLERGSETIVHAVDSGQIAVSSAATLTELEPAEQSEVTQLTDAEILKRSKEIRARKSAERREKRIANLVKISEGNTELGTDVKYPVILADPPWQYEFSQTESREIENHYPTMDLQAIKDMPVEDLCTPDAILFLWVTAPKLEEGLEVLRAWGFEYRTCFVWDKVKKGLGIWARIQHEMILIGRRGDFPAPKESDRFDSAFRIERTEHSKKPDHAYEMIEQMYPELSKIELFCRNPREGWATWGNQSAAEVQS